MKNFLLLVALVLISISLTAQTSKWFFTASSGYSIGGPGPSIKKNMKENGFNVNQGGWNNFITGSPTKYPHNSQELLWLVTLGKRIGTNRSVYLIFGESTKGSVKGFSDVSGLSVTYSVLQFTAGYQFSFPRTRFKIGAGPSAFLFRYWNSHLTNGESNSTIKPGVSVTGRIPFGKEKKLIGLELFFETNFAPPAQVEELKTYMSSLKATKVNMVHGIIGLSLALRK